MALEHYLCNRQLQVDATIHHWGKLGYDQHERGEVGTPGSRRLGQEDLPVRHMRLTFVKT